jgi:hypothetical protein
VTRTQRLPGKSILNWQGIEQQQEEWGEIRQKRRLLFSLRAMESRIQISSMTGRDRPPAQTPLVQQTNTHVARAQRKEK